MSDKSKYSIDSIQALKWNEAVRLRPELYIDHINLKGFVETINNILSLFLDHINPDKVSIELKENYSVVLKFNDLKASVKSNKHKWGPGPRPINQFISEFSVLNALSKEFKISFSDSLNKIIEEQHFEKGELVKGRERIKEEYPNIQIEFLLEQEIWGTSFSWNEIFISHEMKELAYFHKNVKFEIKYKVDKEDCKIIYHFKNGLKDRIGIEELHGLGSNYFEIAIDKEFENFHLEAAFAFRDSPKDKSYLKSYVNDTYTSKNGSHADALLKGLTHGVMKYLQKHKLTESYSISKKGIKESLIAVINIKIGPPFFKGRLKNKFTHSEIVEPIADYISDLFFKKMEEEEESTKKLISKFKL